MCCDLSTQPGAAAQAGEGARARAPRGRRADQARRRAARARARARLRELAEAEGVRRAARRSSSRSTPTSSTTRGARDGIATTGGVTIAEARRDLAQRHGFSSWRVLTRHVEALRDGERAADAVRARVSRGRGETTCHALAELLDRIRSSSSSAARTATTCSAWRTTLSLVRAAARARRRSEPRQRLRLDEAPRGRLLERARSSRS